MSTRQRELESATSTLRLRSAQRRVESLQMCMSTRRQKNAMSFVVARSLYVCHSWMRWYKDQGCLTRTSSLTTRSSRFLVLHLLVILTRPLLILTNSLYLQHHSRVCFIYTFRQQVRYAIVRRSRCCSHLQRLSPTRQCAWPQLWGQLWTDADMCQYASQYFRPHGANQGTLRFRSNIIIHQRLSPRARRKGTSTSTRFSTPCGCWAQMSFRSPRTGRSCVRSWAAWQLVRSISRVWCRVQGVAVTSHGRTLRSLSRTTRSLRQCRRRRGRTSGRR